MIIVFLFLPLVVVNPPPLLMGRDIDPTPLDSIWLVTNYRPEIGAYEFDPRPTAWRLGDLSCNHRLTAFDAYWFALCWRGPRAETPTHLTRSSDGERVRAACWLADFNYDGHVDMRDYASLANVVEDGFRWGDVNRDRVVDQRDVDAVVACMDRGAEIGDCENADVNESLWINSNDLELVEQALARQGGR